MTRQDTLATRPHPQYPHFNLVYDLPSPMQTVDDAAAAAKYLRTIWPPTIDVEVSMAIVMLNQYNQPIAHHLVPIGNPAYQNDILAHLRMIGWITAQSCASAVYLAHNMPGELQLSRKMDVPTHVTDALAIISKAMDTLDIWLEDHLLITPVSHLSLKSVLGYNWPTMLPDTKEVANG